MVYYYTSANVKLLRKLIESFRTTNDTSSYEYIKIYIENSPEDTDDAKLGWIAETFLSISKHAIFLKELSAAASSALSDEERDYFDIILHAVIYHIKPESSQFLYKTLHNLSKPLLKSFTNFLNNNEVLCFVSQVAQLYYDVNFISEKIIRPLFEWQPQISEMTHKYAENEKKIEKQKTKPPVVPQHLNVLNRKSKPAEGTKPVLPLAPPNSVVQDKSRKMLTKSAIDRKLQRIHEKHQQEAMRLLNDIKSKNHHYQQNKSEAYCKKILNIKDEIEKSVKTFSKPKLKSILMNTTPMVKETSATVKRIKKRIQMSEEDEIKWLIDLTNNCRNTVKIEELEQYDRQESKRERLLDIEKKHLLGQISYEEAILAKKKLQEDKKGQYAEFLKEKEKWYEEIENWKKIEIEKNRKQFEKLCLEELNGFQAKNDCILRRKENADMIKKESEIMLKKALKLKQEELDGKIKMVKEIKILAMIAKKAKIPKIVDLTDTSGIGSLCEMSIAELRERINAMKIVLNEELQRKREIIRENRISSKLELEEAKANIKDFMEERAMLRKQNKIKSINTKITATDEINELKKILEEKRKMRIDMTRNN